MIKLKWLGKLGGVLLAVLFSTLFSMNVGAVNNPVSYEGQINDCDVIKYNGEYYIQGNWLKGDMLRSRDLTSWGERKHVYSWTAGWHSADSTDDRDFDIHGTHIRYYNGVFHLYAHLGVADGIAHATSSNIWGPYTEPVNNPFGITIDGETFLDEDGSFHFYSTVISAQNGNYYRPMSDLSTLTGSYARQVYTWNGSSGWESGTHINEGPKVMKYRNRYYQLYAAYPTENVNYAIGCVEADHPWTFSNAGKYDAAVCSRYTPPGHDEIAYIGQPWVVDGLNGFEKWMGYFASTTSDGRTQRIDRMHFFDRTMFIDGPTDRWTPGYHPAPAKPQLLNIFPMADGALPASDWNPQAGTWSVANEEALQTDQNAWAFNTVNRDAARNYLVEANLKFTQAQDAEDKAGVLAYYQDVDNYVLVGLNRVADDWYMHVREGGVDTVTTGSYAGSVNYSVYHKIRVTKNAGTFDVRIDNMIPPGFVPAVTGLGVGHPGIFTDHTAAAFDGIIYTIGWDEFDGAITGWGDNSGGFSALGDWTVGSDGITMADGTGYTFKGDLMSEYEVATQVYKEGSTDGNMGIFAAAIDGNNYVYAIIDTASNQLQVGGKKGGADLTAQTAGVDNKDSYNIRVVKLSNKFIVFVDGVEKITLNQTYGPSQVGLYTLGMSARYNGIMAYRTEPAVAPAEWTVSDIGSPGFAGTLQEYDHALYMTGSGHDIWGPSDGLAFSHKDTSGDWEFVTRLVNLDKTDYWAKAGLMFRDGLDANAPMVMVAANAGNQGNEWSIPDDRPRIQFIWRDTVGGNAAAVELNQLSFPMWLKLKRTGDTFTGYHSSDGQTWALVGTHVSPIASSGKIGYSVTSHNNDRSASAVYDNITLVGQVPLTPGTIGNSQVIYEDENPATFTSVAAATGNDPVSYQWRYKVGSGGAWANAPGTSTGATYTAPNLDGTFAVDTELFFHRKATDAYHVEDSNEVSLMVKTVFDTSGDYIFIDNFNVSDTGDVNSNYATRQAGGGGISPYTYAVNYSIANNKLKNLNGDLALNADMARYIVGKDFEFSFKVAKPEAGGSLTSIFLFDGTDGGDRRGDSRLGMYINDGWACVFYKGTGAGQEIDAVSESDMTALLGSPYSNTDEHTFQFVSHAGAGGINTYDLVIDGVKVASDVSYSFDGPERRIGVVGSMGSAGAFYDDISIRYVATYSSWSDEHSLVGADADRDADPDDDGMENLAEYALGGNPNVADAGIYLPSIGITEAGSSNFVDYIYNRRLDAVALGLTYGLNSGTNLMDSMGYVGTTYETDTTTIDAKFESVTNSVPFAGDTGFVELKVTED